MRRIFVYLVVGLFCLTLGVLGYHAFMSFGSSYDVVLFNTQSALKAEEAAAIIKTNLDAQNKIIIDNQDKIKEDIRSIIEEQFKAATKDLLTQKIYKAQNAENNRKLNLLLGKKHDCCCK